MTPSYRAVSTLVSSGASPEVQAEALGRTVDAERWEPYGLATSPPIGGDVLVLSVAGSADHPAAVVCADRQERPTDLAPHDVALWTRHGHEVRITSSGVDLGATGGDAVARVDDTIEIDLGSPANNDWLTWLQAVATATGIPLPLGLVLYGTITSGSATVRAA